MTENSFDVFLSHNGQDKPAVERLAERLRRAGVRPWLDKWELTAGARWQDELHAGLLACRAFAYFLGPNGEGDWAREELDAARSRAAKDREFRIFPVLLPGMPDPFDRTTMPPFLGHRTWVDFRGGLDDPTAFQSLINAVRGVPLGAPMELEAAPADADVVPYRGLDAFDEADARWFFGREPDVQQLLERLKAGRFLAVLGPSGSGKSSLVRAGLVPALRRGALPSSEGWRIEMLKPGERPAEEIAARLLRLGDGGGMQATLDGLLGDERSLHLAGTLALGDDPRGRLVWVIDQAEELFTLCHDEAERSAAIRGLLYAASVPGGRSVVVLAMRADFYARAAAYPELAAHISRAQHLVAPLTADGLRDAIEEPARAVGLAFEEGLVGTILDDLEGEPGSLPLLQYALLELWKRRRGGLLTLEAYRESGGVQGAIAKRAEAIYAGFTPEEQAIVRRALLRLTQPGEGTEDTRRRATMRELVTRVDEQQEVQVVIGELTDARLLTASADPSTGEGLVDISHEALIRAWPRVRQWLDEDRAGQRVLRRITEASTEWQRLGRDEGLLFRGARLAEAEEWRADHDATLNDQERAFLDASVALRERERQARERARRRVTVAAGALAAVFLVLAAVAGLQWLSAEESRQAAVAAQGEALERAEEAEQQRQIAEQQRLAAEQQRRAAEQQRRAADEQRRAADEQRQAAEQARAEAEAARTEALARAIGFKAVESAAYRDRAMLLALEAYRRARSPDTRGLLLRELGAEPHLDRFVGELGPPVVWLDIADDRSNVAWIDVQGRVRVAAIADPDTLLVDAVVPGGGQGTGVALSADGTRAVASAGPTVALWDVPTGRQLWAVEPQGPPGAARVAFVDGEEGLIALAAGDASVWLIDPSDGHAVRQTVPPQAPLGSATALGPWAIAFDRTGGTTARGEQDGRVTVWRTATGELVAGPLTRAGPETADPPPTYSVVDLGFGSDDTDIAVLFTDGWGLAQLAVPEGATEPVWMLAGALPAPVTDGLRVAITGDEGGYLLGSANRGLLSLPFATIKRLVWEPVGAHPYPFALDTTRDSDTAIAGYPDGRLAIYRLQDRWGLAGRIAGLPHPPYGTPARDEAYAIRRDGAVVAWYQQDLAAVRVMGVPMADIDASEASIVDLPVTGWIESLALSDDGTLAVMVEDRPVDGGWTGHLVVRSIPDGALVLERPLGTWAAPGFRVAPSPDGDTVAVSGPTGAVTLQDLRSGEVRWAAPIDPEGRAVSALEVAPDGVTLRAGAVLGSGPFGQATLLAWDTATGLEQPRVTVDADRISAIATSPDGRRVMLAASDAQAWADGRLVILDIGDRTPAGSLGEPHDGFGVLRWTPDGRLLSSGPTTGWLTWAVDPARWEERACEVASRDLTPAEWRDALGDDEPWQPTCVGLPDPTSLPPDGPGATIAP